jgi:hypothetical protein
MARSIPSLRITIARTFSSPSNKQLYSLQHIMMVLAEDGRTGVALPDNVGRE